MSPRTITITVADYQRIEARLIAELANERRVVVCQDRRIGELEDECLRLQTERDEALAQLATGAGGG